MDFENRTGIVFGSAYGGSVKKHIFTVMNYLLPDEGILPLHCSANEGTDGDVALMLGLSGTGKTTLSTDPDRRMIGDDEHGWSDEGVANFENGLYAKLINLDPEKEPGIYNAIFSERPVEEHGCIVENAMMYPNGEFDLSDSRYTPNSRGSFPISFLENIRESSKGAHPRVVLFLTADANGVLPPVSRLNPEQAMLWFMMGYTSKLAGTEVGIVEPQSTFSRFFGAPFMPRNPSDYSNLLGEKMRKHGTEVFLVNTGWSGGPFGIGKRMDITLTRGILKAIFTGDLRKMRFIEDKRFHVMVPDSCPGVDSKVLNPKNTWEDKRAFEKRADKLAREFSENFDKSYGASTIQETVIKQCPGK